MGGGGTAGTGDEQILTAACATGRRTSRGGGGFPRAIASRTVGHTVGYFDEERQQGTLQLVARSLDGVAIHTTGIGRTHPDIVDGECTRRSNETKVCRGQLRTLLKHLTKHGSTRMMVS